MALRRTAASCLRRCMSNYVETSLLSTIRNIEAPLANSVAGSQLQQVRWASKKQGGSTQNNKDSNPKYLGVKMYGGQRTAPGNIIVRQRGTEFHPGLNVGMGRDHTIYSLIDGHIKFAHDRQRKRTFINVEPLAVPQTAVQANN